MPFTETEKKRRQEALQKLLAEKELQALVLIGNMTVGHSYHGDFRWYTDNHIFFQRQVAVLFPGIDPILFNYSDFSKRASMERSMVKDVRVSTNFIADTVTLIKAQGAAKGKIGVNFEMLPTTWYRYLRTELPDAQLLDVHEDIMAIRFQHSDEEIEIYRKGAALADQGFQAALNMIRPGVTEYEIVAEIEYVSRRQGTDEHFTLIGSGQFSFNMERSLPLPVSPSERKIQAGESIVLEITPRYKGYWTQLVRMVNVGKPNEELRKMQTVARDAIRRGIEEIQPGRRVKDVALAMQAYIAKTEFVPRAPFGHVCGIDLVEERVSVDNESLFIPGYAAIVHPLVQTADGKNVIFWGETYLATREGYERLHTTGDDLITI
ncbi:MAG TPA: Xaa-Pro peptidase family protein [Syntrophorhabdales bacterium]|nr:Xaa-Pro peptidase family protein [Syntrophorhabdales bacterium]